MATRFIGRNEAAQSRDVVGPARRGAQGGATISLGASFLVLVLGLAVYLALSWPVVFSLDLWVFKDRGNFLRLDWLLAQGRSLGVDTYYQYGLLPVLVQHVLFRAFGAGFAPILAFNICGLVALAGIWALLARRMTRDVTVLFGLVLITPILFWANPNLPYLLVQLSMLAALYLVAQGRLETALPVAVVGCFAVPSLSLVLAALIAAAILRLWFGGPDRRLGDLGRRLLPGIGMVVALAGLLSAWFGPRSLLATALPLNGMAYYETRALGLRTLAEFLLPEDVNRIAYTLFWPPLWWCLSTVALLIFGCAALERCWRDRQDGGALMVLFCAIVHAIFFLFAYGFTEQHIIYDPILCLGVLGGIFFILPTRFRKPVFLAFVLIGAVGQIGNLKHSYKLWRDDMAGPATAGLYADRQWTQEWRNLLDLSASKRLFLLSYGTGITHYFPTIGSPRLWTLEPGQVLPSEKAMLLDDMAAADIVAVDRSGPTVFIEQDPDIQRCLHTMVPGEAMRYFQIWQKGSGC